MKRWILVLFVGLSLVSNAQKPLAKSILNQKMPELEIENWIGAKPDIEGKWIIIDFWATWCMPCRAAMRELNDYHDLYNDKLVIIGLTHEDEATIKTMKAPVLDYYVAYDTQERLKNRLDVRGIPYALLIDPAGIVRWEGNPLDPQSRLDEDLIELFINQ